MNDIQRQQIIDQATDSILAANRDIAALAGFVNATRAYQTALKTGNTKTFMFLANALSLPSFEDLQFEFHLKTDEQIEQAVTDSEAYLKKFFSCDIRAIEKSERAKNALDATRILINQAVGGNANV
jgi:hypothetical protein